MGLERPWMEMEMLDITNAEFKNPIRLIICFITGVQFFAPDIPEQSDCNLEAERCDVRSSNNHCSSSQMGWSF